MKIKAEVIIDLEDFQLDWTDDEEIDWFNSILLGTYGNELLILHSNEIGDEIGPVEILGWSYYENHT